MKSLHDLEDLRTRLQARLAPGPVEDIRIFDALPSTNAALMAQPFASRPAAPILCWALHQTAGRGRRGRQWFSDPAQSLTFSLAFEAPIDPGQVAATLSPACGLALARALDRLSPGVRVKWPNDLWRRQRKMAGVLLEATHRGPLQRVVIGVGINLCWTRDGEAPTRDEAQRAAPAQPPGGLFDEPVDDAGRLQVLASAVAALCEAWQVHHDPLRSARRFDDWPAYDALAGQAVSLYSETRCMARGRIAGVASDGALLLHEDGRDDPAPTRHEVGELSLRAQGA